MGTKKGKEDKKESKNNSKSNKLESVKTKTHLGYVVDPKKLKRRRKEDRFFNNWSGRLATGYPSDIDGGMEKVKEFLSPPVPPVWIPEKTVINFFLRKFEAEALQVLKAAGHEIDITEENPFLYGDLTSQQEEFAEWDVQLASANRVLLSAYSIRQIIFDEDPQSKAKYIEDALFEMMQLTACSIKAKLAGLINLGIDGVDAKRFRSMAGKAKKGTVGDIKKTIHAIAKRKRKCDLQAILNVFKDDANGTSDLMCDLRGARQNPISIKIQEVGEKTVYYSENEAEKKVSVKSIKNILSAYKKQPLKQSHPVNPAIK